jgi:hypothetical protein
VESAAHSSGIMTPPGNIWERVKQQEDRKAFAESGKSGNLGLRTCKRPTARCSQQISCLVATDPDLMPDSSMKHRSHPTVPA